MVSIIKLNVLLVWKISLQARKYLKYFSLCSILHAAATVDHALLEVVAVILILSVLATWSVEKIVITSHLKMLLSQATGNVAQTLDFSFEYKIFNQYTRHHH